MFLSDQETAVDLLYYESIAITVAKLIRDAEHKALTIGVHGDWGAGKSSVLKMVEAGLAADKGVVCLWFNGWTFEGFEDAKTVVLEEIVEALRRARPTSTKVGEAAKKALGRIEWLKVAKHAGGIGFNLLTGLPAPGQIENIVDAGRKLLSKKTEDLSGEDVEGFVDTVGGLVKAPADGRPSVPSQVHAFRKDFEELLAAAEITRLVVLVDDLDRCLPETAIATLEAIRLFLFVPNTAFVIGADEAMIEYSVRRHFPELPASSGPSSYARSYLEKLVQVPFRIPPLGGAETRIYVTLLLAQAELREDHPAFAKLLQTAREALRLPWAGGSLDRRAVEDALGGQLPAGLEQVLRISDQISGILSEGSRGNPRQVKRFLNSMALRLAVAEARKFRELVDRAVLAKLMLAERFAPDFYDQMARLATVAPDGKPAELASLEKAAREGTPRAAPSSSPARRAQQKAADAPPALPAIVEDWLKGDWVRDWAAIDPTLVDVDLRPYLFVSRDKRALFGVSNVSSHLSALVDRLMGEMLAAKVAEPEAKALGPLDAERVFDAIRQKISEREDLKTKPPGADGMALLVAAQPALQSRLLEFLTGLDPMKLGIWAVTSWSTCLIEADQVRAFEGLKKSWGAAGNPTLKAGVEAAAAMGSKR